MSEKPRNHQRGKWLNQRLNDAREAFEVACEFARLEQEKDVQLTVLKQAMETIATCDAPAWVLRVIAMRALCGVVVHSFDIEAFELTGEERAELEKTGTLRYKGKEKDPFVKKPEPEAAPVKAKTMSMAPKLVTAERLKVPKKERAERVFAIDPRDQPQRVFKSQSEWANK